MVAELATGEFGPHATLEALESLAGRSLGAILIGPERDGRGRPRVRFHEGGLRVDLPSVESGRWLAPGSALAIRGRGRVLVWDQTDRRAVRAVTTRLVQLLGAKLTKRVLAQLEAAA
jgi:hypothetical protein